MKAKDLVAAAKAALQRGEISDEQFQMLVRYALASEIRSGFSEKSSRYLEKYGKSVVETGEVS